MQTKESKKSKYTKQSQNKVISITHPTKSEFKEETNYSRNHQIYNSISSKIKNRSAGKRSNSLDYERKNYVHSDIGATLGIITIYVYDIATL